MDATSPKQFCEVSGNVRELSHLMERVTLLSPEARIAAETLARLCLPRVPLAMPAAAMNTSRVERLRSLGSGSSSSGFTRCQISVKILPAISPPRTLMPIERGLYKAFDVLMATTFPRREASKHGSVN